MKCRKSVAQLSLQDKQDFVGAMLALKDSAIAPSRIPAAQAMVTAGGGMPNRYDDYVWIHHQVGHGAHRGPGFGPWHREFLRQLEFDLQQVSGNPELTIPYWDWTVAQSPASPGWPFTDDLMGGFGNAVTGLVSSGPFADSAAWRINIRLPGDQSLTLKRRRGVPAASFLPRRADVLHGFGVGVASAWPSVYDAAPFHPEPSQLPNTEVTALADAAFRKYLEWLLHDGVHGWVGAAWDFVSGFPTNGGHMTFVPVSVNDPVFFLHHCNIDRLWAIWQRKSPSSAYVPLGAGAANTGHNGGDVMIRFDNPSHFNSPPNQHPTDVLNYHALGYWFQSDLPEIALSTPSIDFGNVPENEMSVRSLEFTVRTCQPVTISVAAVSGSNFSAVPTQDTITVGPAPGSDIVTATLGMRFEALGPVAIVQTGTATIQATIVDNDGYDAPAIGDPFVVGTWTVSLEATPVSSMDDDISQIDIEHGMFREQGGDADHEHMLVFPAFRRDASGQIAAVDLESIPSDTSQYDSAGNDRSGAEGNRFENPEDGEPHHEEG